MGWGGAARSCGAGAEPGGVRAGGRRRETCSGARNARSGRFSPRGAFLDLLRQRQRGRYRWPAPAAAMTTAGPAGATARVTAAVAAAAALAGRGGCRGRGRTAGAGVRAGDPARRTAEAGGEAHERAHQREDQDATEQGRHPQRGDGRERPRVEGADAGSTGHHDDEDALEASAHGIRNRGLHHRRAIDGADVVGGAGDGQRDRSQDDEPDGGMRLVDDVGTHPPQCRREEDAPNAPIDRP